MPGLTFQRIDGVLGGITIPMIGLEIGTFSNWTLKRREEIPLGYGEWDLHAVFSFINEYAFFSEEWEKEYRITLGSRKNGRQYRLDVSSGRTVLSGRSLLIEGVKLNGVDEQGN